MKYTVLIERYAQKQIMRLDKKAIPVIKSAIASLADNPRPKGYKKLKGEDAYRIRVGDYRVIYEIDNGKIIVTVVSVGHRKDIYK
ncbi:MAG TPA: type II toxin-antitoxin system RelE/ParE family toxin [Bacteroidales bacterium]|jgi:mRNA interferase RelE/StbE|nr:type II toxin-antitoxin system RelE/ParE family toxin [Bacteroidales bacterium]HQH24833.1 type II toxin-antitoxin system RelE/ParE family toxin [Bacteroidales bacterium]HQK71314.1 type II toxin-antitoxin system RelE/ParE family toxin [Bacteroidales bacterium]